MRVPTVPSPAVCSSSTVWRAAFACGPAFCMPYAHPIALGRWALWTPFRGLRAQAGRRGAWPTPGPWLAVGGGRRHRAGIPASSTAMRGRVLVCDGGPLHQAGPAVQAEACRGSIRGVTLTTALCRFSLLRMTMLDDPCITVNGSPENKGWITKVIVSVPPCPRRGQREVSFVPDACVQHSHRGHVCAVSSKSCMPVLAIAA